MATSPSFAVTPKIGMGLVSAANTNRDGTGALVDIITGATNGTRVDRVDVVHAGVVTVAPTAGIIRLFLYDGTNNRLFREVPIPANAPTATVAGVLATVFFPNGLVLPATWKIKASTHFAVTGNNENLFNVIAYGGDF